MTFPKARLVVSACLFVGWIGFLLYLVVDSPGVIVSKPQLLISSMIVTADVQMELGQPNPEVTIDEVIWSAESSDRKLPGQKIRIRNLSACAKQQNLNAGGKFLIPLLKRGDAEFQVAPLPTGELRMYPWTERVRGQVDALLAARQ